MNSATPARPFADTNVRRVALLRARVGLGDLLASVPALRALRRSRPDLDVVMIAYPEVAPVVARQAAYVDELLAFPGWSGIPDRPVDEERGHGYAPASRRGVVVCGSGQSLVASVTAALAAPARHKSDRAAECGGAQAGRVSRPTGASCLLR